MGFTCTITGYRKRQWVDTLIVADFDSYVMDELDGVGELSAC
jgi:hypothetical protein